MTHVLPPLSSSPRRLPRAGLVLMACALLAGAPAWAQSGQTPGAGGIYTCVNAQGKRLTSDRPILECIDREQRELNRSGTVKRVIEPTRTAAEREAEEARARQAELQRQRERDAVRRDQALVTRYPNRAAHDEGRREALAQSQAVMDMAQSRLNALTEERKKLDQEMEFHQKDPSGAPPRLRRSIQTNEEAQALQRRAIENQQDERQRINARFDKELERLQVLWQGGTVTGASTSASAATKP